MKGSGTTLRISQGATQVERMKRKLKTNGGTVIYAARKMRGMDKVRAEWSPGLPDHNILQAVPPL